MTPAIIISSIAVLAVVSKFVVEFDKTGPDKVIQDMSDKVKDMSDKVKDITDKLKGSDADE